MGTAIDTENHRYPFCVVWTPLPFFTWLFPFIGHMGICTSTGVIRDFAGPYRVSEDSMAFGNPTKYWQLNPAKVAGGAAKWDQAVTAASDTYCSRMHTICDNCHSHVATALSLMEYDKQKNWNMFKLALMILLYGKSVSVPAFFEDLSTSDSDLWPVFHGCLLRQSLESILDLIPLVSGLMYLPTLYYQKL